MEVTRRDRLKSFVSAGAALALGRLPISAQRADPLLTPMIPSSGESLPVIGLGSAGSSGGTGAEVRLEPLREILDLNQVDNMGGGVGELPDDGLRTRMEAFFDGLPSGW